MHRWSWTKSQRAGHQAVLVLLAALKGYAGLPTEWDFEFGKNEAVRPGRLHVEWNESPGYVDRYDAVTIYLLAVRSGVSAYWAPVGAKVEVKGESVAMNFDEVEIVAAEGTYCYKFVRRTDGSLAVYDYVSGVDDTASIWAFLTEDNLPDWVRPLDIR